jgi:uncharacterized protein
MKMSGEYVFHGPREEVWEMMRDPIVLAQALPGTKSLDKLSETEYQGEMNVRVGPVGGKFSGKLTVSNENPPESYTLTVEGKGGPGRATGSGDVKLIDQGDGTTLMEYVGDLEIAGRLAAVGQRMIDSVAKSMSKQAFEAMDKALQIRIAAKAQGLDLDEIDYDAPSQVDFAKGVAKDMLSGVFKKKD